jgi:hypothetical protein
VTLAEVEIIARVERRRKRTAEEKTAPLAEVEADGGKVAVVARRRRISESVLYNWRAALKATAAARQVSVAAPFIPLGVFADRAITIHQCWRPNRAAGALEVAVANQSYTGPMNAAQIVLGTALGLVEPRLPVWKWRDGRVGPSAWYDTIAVRPSFQSTMPPAL